MKEERRRVEERKQRRTCSRGRSETRRLAVGIKVDQASQVKFWRGRCSASGGRLIFYILNPIFNIREKLNEVKERTSPGRKKCIYVQANSILVTKRKRIKNEMEKMSLDYFF